MRVRTHSTIVLGGLAALTLLAYVPVLQNGFINLDDNLYVTDNLRVQAGLSWKGVAWALTTGHAANWHPLAWLSHMLDCQVFGMNPVGHHLTSVALHLASTLLLFRLFVRMTAAVLPSAFVAAAFALHPLHVESVAWIAERKDVLSGLAWILTTLAYVRWVGAPSLLRYVSVILLFALGLLAKPMIVTLPFTLLLLDWWPLRRIESPWKDVPGLARLVREKIPLFVLAAGSCTVTYLVQRDAGAMSLGDEIPLLLRAQNAVVAYAAYLWKSLVPTGLVVFYPHPAAAYPGWKVAGSALALAGATVVALWGARERPWLAVGWLWFLGTLVPVIGLVQVGLQAMADRYMYVPMIGLSVAVAYGAADLARRSKETRPVVAVLFACAAAGWTAISWRQVRFFRDDTTLFGHVVDTIPENYLAHGILGNVHLSAGRLTEAEAEYRVALRLLPNYAQGYSNLGMVREFQGRIDEAIGSYETALRFMPSLPEAHHNLARLLAKRGESSKAIEHYEAALRSNPDFAVAHVNLGRELAKTGRLDEAIAHFTTALELKPAFVEAKQGLDAARQSRSGWSSRP